MQKSNILTILISVIASVAISCGICCSKKSTETAPVASSTEAVAVTDAAIENYLKSNPLKIREALEEAARQEQLEAEKRIAQSYKDNINKLHDTKASPFVGPENAKVTIVEFFDFNCGYCKRLAPTLMSVIKANPNVRFVFKPVAFLAPSSQTAAKAVLAAQKKGKFIELYESLLTHGGALSDDVIDQKITEAGLNLDEIKTLMKSDEIQKQFDGVATLSQDVNIRGVPTLIINGEPLQAIEQSQIQQAIDSRK